MGKTESAGLERNANTHLKLVRHHAFAHGIAEEILLRNDRLEVQCPITLGDKAAAKPGANIWNQGLLTDTQPPAQDRGLTEQF